MPAKSAARRTRLAALRSDERTLVFYESPHRIVEMLADIADTFGKNRPVCVARELTKLHEALYFDTAATLAARAATDVDMERGELVVVVGGQTAEPQVLEGSAEKILEVLLSELPAAQAAKLTARITGLPRKDLYELAVRSSS